MSKIAAADRDAFVENRRTEIVEAALRLWSERGYDATSVAAIAAEVGLTKGTLYLYFDSKLALLDEVLRRYSLRPDVEGMLAALREQPLEDVVKLLVEGAWQRLKERRELVAVLLRELPHHLDKAQRFLSEVLVPTNQAIAAYLDEKLPPARALELNTLVAGRSLLSMILVFFFTQEVLGAKELMPIPEEEATSTITKLFLNGVLGGETA